MHKLLAFLFLAAISSVHAGELSVDTRCLSDSKKKINLEFRIYTDSDIGWVGGQLRYRQSEKYIQLTYKSTETLREVEDRPWEFQHTWLEILNGAITGKYEMVSQGAIIYKFTYTNETTGKTVDISNETYTDKTGKCTWANA
ncbi:hypothetical protein [Pseudomonas leptonychotis]|uniref:hypothetical protein n=1 Tax=Pseudomonas leptonychotis TaxID=2448482 RepID=UPI0039EDFB34